MGRNDAEIPETYGQSDEGHGPPNQTPVPYQQQPPQQMPAGATNSMAIAEFWSDGPANQALRDMLPPGSDPRWVLTAWLAAFKDNPALEACTPESKARTLMDCARVRLFPGPAQHIHIVSYTDRKSGLCEAQTQIGWQGYVALLKRECGVTVVHARSIHAGDTWTIQAGSTPRLSHEIALTDRGDVIAWYAVAFWPDATVPATFELMTEPEMQAHRKQYGNDRYGTGPWSTAYPEMAKKTVIKRLSKRIGTGDILAMALAMDPTTSLRGDRR